MKHLGGPLPLNLIPRQEHIEEDGPFDVMIPSQKGL